MAHPDAGVQALRELSMEFGAFRDARGRVTETDTRAKVIDRILTCIIHEGRASVGDGRDLAAKRGLARDARMPAGFEEGVMGPGGRGRPSSETALVEREPFCPRPEAYDARPAG